MVACLRTGPDGTMPCGSGKDATCCASNQCCVTNDSSCRNKCPSAGGGDDQVEDKFAVLLDLLFKHGSSMSGTCQCEPEFWVSTPTSTPTCSCP